MPMLIILILIKWSAYLPVTALEQTQTENEGPYLFIEPISSREYGLHVIKRMQDTLNLTCTVFDNSTDTEPRYNITWSTPSGSTNSKNRVVIQSSANSVNLLVPYLDTKDEGQYTCIAQPLDRDYKPLSSVVIVNIKNRKKECSRDTMFMCNQSKLQNCILLRFKCDGFRDCAEGEDEDHEACGEYPCLNKLQCEEPVSVVRCIPRSWCCDIRIDINCTTKEPLSCCPISFRKTYIDDRSYFHQARYDMSVLQTTIYTVIGCAMVFMIVVTILVIAICRVHLKRATQCAIQSPQSTALYELDRGCVLDTPGWVVTYNINNGVQIMGHAVEPPPYCEVISLPPREGPPPPYTSHEVLDQPETEVLLVQSPFPLAQSD